MSEKIWSVAVIGAGPLGLTAAKAMLEQNLEPTVFEKSSQLGGVWSDTGNIWSGMKMNASKYLVSFSDYPWDSTVPIHPGGEDARRYLHGYAEHFNVLPHIKFNSKVVNARQLDDKKWRLKWANSETQQESEDTFDYLIVASGLFSNPTIPRLEGQDTFQGLIIHSRDYPMHKGTFRGKNIIAIGNSHSGSDISADLAIDGANVLNIFHRPNWVLRRFLPLDAQNPTRLIPYDFVLFGRKACTDIGSIVSTDERNLKKNQIFSTILSEQNQLENTDLHIDPNSSEPPRIAISDNYIEYIKKGLIKTKKSGLRSYNGNEVCFEDGARANADAVIWCTGYTLNMDFFDKETLKSIEYDSTQTVQPLVLYKSTFPRDIENLAFIGMVRDPFYGLGELQSKWVGQVFAGKRKLPSNEEIDKNLELQRGIRLMSPQPQYVCDNFLAYIDDVANELGLLPDFALIKKTDESLYKQLYECVASPAHFQLGTNKAITMMVLNEIDELAKGF